jgi:hypothetical protein
VGVDSSEVFLAAAHARAEELGVADRVRFVLGDAGEPGAGGGGGEAYEVVSCIGATWIGGGLAGTIALMRASLAPGGLMLVGEPYWNDPPPEPAYEAIGLGREDFTSLPGTLERIESTGMELVEMVLADGDSWDRYVAAQWWTVERWLTANPDHPGAPHMRRYLTGSRRSHLTYQRRYLGWGVFVLRG